MSNKIKLQISVSLEMCRRIDAIAKELGMNRSRLCAYFIEQGIKQSENTGIKSTCESVENMV